MADNPIDGGYSPTGHASIQGLDLTVESSAEGFRDLLRLVIENPGASFAVASLAVKEDARTFQLGYLIVADLELFALLDKIAKAYGILRQAKAADEELGQDA